MPPKAIKAICDLVGNAFANVGARDSGILLTLAAAQQDGQCVGMKQLVISEKATATTLRRRISRLIKLGYVEKRSNKEDGRATIFVVTPPVWKRLERLRKELKQVLRSLEARETGA